MFSIKKDRLCFLYESHNSGLLLVICSDQKRISFSAWFLCWAAASFWSPRAIPYFEAECTFRRASVYWNVSSAWLMGLPMFSELNLSPNFLSENFLWICTGKAHLFFICLFVFPASPWSGINFLILFQLFSCHLGQQAMHSFAFPSATFFPILPLYSFDCCSIYSSIQLLCFTCVKLLESASWTVLHGSRSFTDLFWLSMYWMAACDMERQTGFSPSSF